MKTNNGFTLVELLVVVAVIGILAAISMPYYNDYVTRAKLSEATGALSDARVKMEQFFQDNRSYTSGALAANGCPTTLAVAASTTNFTYACSNLSATTYTITAQGLNNVSTFAYTIDQSNARRTTAAPTGWKTASMPGTPASCWIVKKSGTC